MKDRTMTDEEKARILDALKEINQLKKDQKIAKSKGMTYVNYMRLKKNGKKEKKEN